ncbi:MAG: TonB-dependent receptor [Bacteroidia bacterium]|nr:TonB-dependent receptor [Bacteroidia bacterium]
MKSRNLFTLFLISFSTVSVFSQEDSVKTLNLPEIEINQKPLKNEIERMPEVLGTSIYAGKKNEVIKLGNIDADLSVNNSRQVFGKVPGVTVWENDGSGIQVGVSTRGLSPNRSWEFNVRQNGADISGETFGYPEAYYSPPLEGVERIEIIRGAASLQYGPQFGGLMNYVMKKGNAYKPLVFETQQTFGSYGLFNSYNALGGTYKKVSYYAFFHHRGADSWRDNNRYTINAGYAAINYSVTSKLNIGIQYTRSSYLSQQPGGLTDSLFNVDAQQSFRHRNWTSAPWNVATVYADYNISENTKLNIKLFGVMAERTNVGFVKAINIADTFNTTLKSFNPRQVDRDYYTNYGGEIRFLQMYNLMNQKSALAAGVRVYKGNILRRQLGVGTTGDDYDVTITAQSNGKDFSREYNYDTDNIAFFLENMFKIGKRLSITPGVRYEIINSSAKGYLNTSATGTFTPVSENRNVILFGAGAEFQTTGTTNLYANFSQSYRPVTYSELTPSGTTDVIDPNLKDASGYNIDGGFRGRIKDYLSFDIGGFYLLYDNRIGTITQNGLPFRTNIGTSVSQGAEAFVEIDPIRAFIQKSPVGYITLYASYAYVDAKYTRWDNPAIANDPAKSIVGKRVEYAPQNIGRYGATYIYKNISATFQLSQVSEVYSDAANTEKYNAAATVGKVPAYMVMDASLTVLFAKKYNLKAGVNNLSDEKYFTRRAGGYPGPGVMPANGRTIFVSIGAKI